MVKTARLPHGWLRLAVYPSRAIVTVIPDDEGKRPVVREYDWAHKWQAVTHFETIQEAACEQSAGSTTAQAS